MLSKLRLAAPLLALTLWGCAPEPIQCRAEGVLLTVLPPHSNRELYVNIVCQVAPSDDPPVGMTLAVLDPLGRTVGGTGRTIAPLSEGVAGGFCRHDASTNGWGFRYGWSMPDHDDIRVRVNVYNANGDFQTLVLPLPVSDATYDPATALIPTFNCEFSR